MRIRVERFLLSLLVSALISGCSGYRANYDIGLVKADRPVGAVESYGKHDILKVEEDGPDLSYFEDGLVKIIWTPTAEEVAFEITNKTTNPITIVWEQAKFIDDAGAAHRTVHSGVSYTAVSDPQEPSIIKANETHRDLIFSADNIFYSDARWQRKPMFQTFAMSRNAENFDADIQANVGKSFSVVLPLAVNGTVHEYSFAFEVTGVQVGQ
ncbi:MAG: hypothetical protein ABIA59_02935 [Candidatus Latescibacterota bacterium]